MLIILISKNKRYKKNKEQDDVNETLNKFLWESNQLLFGTLALFLRTVLAFTLCSFLAFVTVFLVALAHDIICASSLATTIAFGTIFIGGTGW